jgi:hypothetical protein
MMSDQQFHPHPPYQQPPAPNPPAPNPPAPRPPAPTDVVTAFQIWTAIVLLGVVSAVLMTLLLLQNTDELAQEWLRQMQQAAPDTEVDEAQAQVMARVAIGIAGLILTVFAAVVQLLAFLMRRGRNWARIILTGLSTALIVMAVPTLLSASSTQGGLAFAVSAIGIVHRVFACGALILMHRKEANDYFRASQARW